jgi:hypothetical protein
MREVVGGFVGGERWRRMSRDESVRAAAYAFVFTRLIVFLVILVGGQINHIVGGTGNTTRDFHLSMGKIPVARLLRETVVVADINWYAGIAENGYERRRFDTETQHNWAFFPLFPLLWRAAASVTGELAVTGILLSNLFFFCALVLLHKTTRAFSFDTATADRAVFYLAAFPTSYFFSLPMTEALFLFLTVGSFYAARRRSWWLAGICGALASATRVTGILLLPALALLYWLTYRPDWRRRDALSLALVPVGLVSFMYYLYLVTGNPLAFKDILVTWGRSAGLFVVPLLQYLRHPLMIAIPWDFKLLNFAAAVTALACGLVLLKRRQWTLAFYTLASMVVALSSLLLQSQARYAMVVFPIFMVLAVAGRRARVDELIRAVFLVLLGLMTALFAAHFSIAMA